MTCYMLAAFTGLACLLNSNKDPVHEVDSLAVRTEQQGSEVGSPIAAKREPAPFFTVVVKQCNLF